MRHKISLLLAGTLTMSLLLCACGSPDDASKPSDSPSPSVSASQNSESPKASNSAEINAPTEEPSQGEDTASPAITSPDPSETPAEPSDSPEPSGAGADPSVGPAGPSDAAPSIETAMSFIGDSVENLIATIGEPDSTDYAPSCLGSGEDGELIYDGFTVYTYREGNTETVQDVL